MNMPRIYTDPSQSDQAVEIIQDLETLESKLGGIPEISDEETAATVGEFRAQVQQRKRDLEKEKKEMGKPLNDLRTMLYGKFNPHIENAERIVQVCDNLLRPWLRKKREEAEEAERIEREQRDAEERALREQEEAERLAAEATSQEEIHSAERAAEEAKQEVDALRRSPAPLKPPKTMRGSHGSSVGIRKVWKYRVIDITQVPEEYLVPPDDRVQKGILNSVAKSQQDKAKVPGIEFYYEDSVASSAR